MPSRPTRETRKRFKYPEKVMESAAGNGEMAGVACKYSDCTLRQTGKLNKNILIKSKRVRILSS